MYTKSSTSAVKCEKVRSTPCPDGADPNGSGDATGRDARHKKSHFPKVMWKPCNPERQLFPLSLSHLPLVTVSSQWTNICIAAAASIVQMDLLYQDEGWHILIYRRIDQHQQIVHLVSRFHGFLCFPSFWKPQNSKNHTHNRPRLSEEWNMPSTTHKQ